MAGQHYHSRLSQELEAVQYCPVSSGNIVFIKCLGFSTDPQGLLLVQDVGISANSWNSSPFLSTTQQYGFSSPTVDRMNRIVDTPNPILGHSKNQYLVTLPSNENSLANEHQRPLASMDLCSRSDTFYGPLAQDKVPDVFGLEVNSMSVDDLAPGIPLRYFGMRTFTSQTHGQMTNESQAITDAVAKSGDRQHSIIDAQFPIMPFCAKPFPNDFSCSPLSSKCSISVATRGPSILQEENQAPQTHGEGEHLESPLQPYSPRDRGTSGEKMTMEVPQCSSCCVRFSQRQGLLRHNKDKHEAKKRCDFCEEFTWPRGRRYVYRRHLQEVHPGNISPSMRATPMARKKKWREV
ncbi:hypothetical protein V8E53_000832 [Lactarius tabidus]